MTVLKLEQTMNTSLRF